MPFEMDKLLIVRFKTIIANLFKCRPAALIGALVHMQKLMLLAALFLLSPLARAQSLSLDVHTGKLADHINLEKRLNSEQIENKSQYLLEQGVAQPIIYRRKQENVPDLLCYYFYYEKDSAIQYILYEWDETNFKGYMDSARKTTAEIKNYISTHDALYAQISGRYGKGEQEGDLSDISKVEEGIQRKDTWKPDDSTEIRLETGLSNKYLKNGAVTINPTFRIRLYVVNTGKSEHVREPEFNRERMVRLDTTSRRFFLAMKGKLWEEARGYLSSLVSQTVTSAQLEQLSKVVRFDEKMELLFSGPQRGLGGQSFYLLAYKYSSDTATPPEMLLKIFFDDSEKIAGIRPMKAM